MYVVVFVYLSNCVGSCTHFCLNLAAFPDPASNNGVRYRYRYVEMVGQKFLQLPERYIVILDCLPLAVFTFGKDANLSSFQWFRIPTRSPGSAVEITDNSSAACIFLGETKTKLYIAELRTARGSDVGTEATYKCSVCRNGPLQTCKEANTTVNVEREWPHMHPICVQM